MAAGAENGGIGLGWGHGTRIIGVLRLRSVAGLAVHVRMHAGLLHFEYVAVTCLTSVMPGVVRLAAPDLTDRGGAVVSILAKTFGDNEAANSPEDQECDHEKSCKSKKMCCVFHSVLIPAAAAEGNSSQLPQCDPDHEAQQA